jgi:hypothetical protein
VSCCSEKMTPVLFSHTCGVHRPLPNRLLFALFLYYRMVVSATFVRRKSSLCHRDTVNIEMMNLNGIQNRTRAVVSDAFGQNIIELAAEIVHSRTSSLAGREDHRRWYLMLSGRTAWRLPLRSYNLERGLSLVERRTRGVI